MRPFMLGVASLALFLGLGISARAQDRQEIEAPGLGVPFAVIKTEAKAPFIGTTADDLRVRLKAGGTVTLGGTDLVLGPPNFAGNELFFMALDTLELKRGSRIVTGGNTLVLFVNTLISEDGAIVAFKSEDGRAAAGNPGDSGGLVSIHVIDKIVGILHTNLSAQNGGPGLPGVPGRAGVAGRRGQDASSGVFGCNHDGENGADGSPGEAGVRGGDGAAGGQGGILELFNIGSRPIPAASFTFAALQGTGGAPGIGGPGGPGGPGGEGGSGGGFCHGGHPGNPGPPGPKGPDGARGADGAQGRAIVKNIDLEFAVKTAQEGKPPQP